MQQSRSEVTERDGLVELSAGSDVLDSPRYNHDIAPTRVEQRTWNRWHITALWIGMSICVPTYTLGGVLTAYFGLSVGEALLAILLANLVVLIPLTLNAFAGTRYGIPFPVLLRASFGIIGSNVPCLIRAVVACGWFGRPHPWRWRRGGRDPSAIARGAGHRCVAGWIAGRSGQCSLSSPQAWSRCRRLAGRLYAHQGSGLANAAGLRARRPQRP